MSEGSGFRPEDEAAVILGALVLVTAVVAAVVWGLWKVLG